MKNVVDEKYRNPQQEVTSKLTHGFGESTHSINTQTLICAKKYKKIKMFQIEQKFHRLYLPETSTNVFVTVDR